MEVVKSRKLSSFRNTIFGIVSQLIQLILSFVCRTILIKKLGGDILGINGLYQNILAVLSLAELGIGNVLFLGLYKPLANKDEKKIVQTIQYYGKVYNIIALIVFVLGLLVLPFLNLIISNDVSISNQDIFIYYLIFLLNSCVSYILCYRQSIINADQKNYIIKIVNTIISVCRFSLQILLLLVIPNYKIYLIVALIATLLQNVILDFLSKKYYPYLKNKVDEPLPVEDKNEIKRNIKSTFIYKVGVVIHNNTDAIFISTLVSTLAVGIYSNYNLIVGAVNGFISIIIYSLFASIGNLSTEKNKQKSFEIFNSMLLFFQYLALFCSLCFITIFNDFITIWAGPEYLFDFKTVIIITLLFYTSTVVSPVWVFRENFGLLHEIKYLMLLSAGFNILFSLLLGKVWGVFGILLATILSKLITTYAFEPIILFKKVFDKKPGGYYLKQILLLLVFCAFSVFAIFIGTFLPSGWLGIFIKIILNFILATVFFVVCFCKTKEFKFIHGFIKEIFSKITRKFRRNKNQESVKNQIEKNTNEDLEKEENKKEENNICIEDSSEINKEKMKK